jgi:hypothetical protein
MQKSKYHDVTEECLKTTHDAHHIAGLLLIEKVDAEAFVATAKQMERTARYLRKLAGE